MPKNLSKNVFNILFSTEYITPLFKLMNREEKTAAISVTAYKSE